MPAHTLDTPAVRADMLRESARRAIARAEPHHRPPATQHAAQGKEASAESRTQREHEEALRALKHTFESRDEKKAKIWSLEGGGMASSFVDLLGSTSVACLSGMADLYCRLRPRPPRGGCPVRCRTRARQPSCRARGVEPAGAGSVHRIKQGGECRHGSRIWRASWFRCELAKRSWGALFACCWRRACGRARLARAGWRVTRRDYLAGYLSLDPSGRYVW